MKSISIPSTSIKNINMRFVILPLRVIAVLSAFVFVLNFCYEIFISYNSRTNQQWAISGAIFVLAVWAVLDLRVIANNIVSSFLKNLYYFLWLQVSIAMMRPVIGFFIDISTNYSWVRIFGPEMGWRWFLLIVYAGLFIAIMDSIINLFSFNEKKKAQALESENDKLLIEKESLIYTLQKANKTAATGALSAAIAHELNQPLGASSLNIQLLKMILGKEAFNAGQVKEVLDSLEGDNQRAATIVKSMRSIFTEADTKSKEIQLGDLIVKVLNIVKPDLKSKNIQIKYELDNDLMIRVNPSELQQVILNLLINAIQSLENSKGTNRNISIQAVKEHQSVRLSISDNGSGVPAEFRPQLFELLYTTKQNGMGLGLWLCKHIITKNVGTISYEDAADGGAKFVMELPSY
jgi:signal transduction histidine kinase